jgi:long-chain acyl-CoA synthetase
MSFLSQIAETLSGLGERPLIHELEREAVTTGADLLRRAGGYRQALVERGVSAGDRVVLVAGNSADWIAVDLAALALGAVLVPFDVRLEAVTVRDLCADCRPRLILAQDPAALGDGFEAPVLDLAELSGEADWTAPVEVPDDAPATIIYTSGSTGRPKGAVLTHANLAFMLERTRARLEQLTGLPVGDDRALHYLPLCYAGSRILLHSCLLRGARLELVADPKRLGDALGRADAHYFLNVPLVLERFRRAARDGVANKGAVLRGLLHAAESAWERIESGKAFPLGGVFALTLARWLIFPKIKGRLGSDLKGVICGSAPLAVATQRWYRMLGVEIYQGYGLTETTALCTLDVEGAVRPGWVGPALPGVELRVSSEGELQTRGPHVFPGYWERDEATAEAFTADGWFKTGDLGELDDQGRARIAGRASALLVLQTGHNVPPEPHEEALRLALGGDPQVCLVGHGKPCLAALVAGEGLARESVQAAVDALNAEAAPHKKIRAFHLCPEPFTAENGLLTANLKLRRRVIAERFAEAIDGLYADAVAAR